MKKITETSNWKRYKETDGKEVIAMFNHLTTPEASVEDMLEVIKRFDPGLIQNSSKKEIQQQIDKLNLFVDMMENCLPQTDEEWKDFDAGEFYLAITHLLAVEDKDMDLLEAPQIGFKNILGSNAFLSMALYAYLPETFVPNLFVMQFAYFKKFAQKYDLELPETPKRSDYRMRWLYYLDICNVINKFADDNGFQDPGELCAFLYDYEITNLKEELETDYNMPLPEIPENVWILVGSYSEGEKTMESGFWQSNAFTQRGDIMLFYEKSPVKKLNAVWRALGDGFVDPFGHFYSFSYIGQKIEIPEDKAITFEEFKENEYFKTRTKEGNFVSKNFQDVSGWEVSSEDYKEIKLMLEAKGFDTSILPSLYEPQMLEDIIIDDEKDVENKIIIHRLNEMGWKEGKDFERQFKCPAGRGSIKRADFALHVSGPEEDRKVKVIIEAKEFIKNDKELKEAFRQHSYANFAKAKVFVLWDKVRIRVYKEKNDSFGSYNSPTERFLCKDLSNPDQFNKLKRLLDI